MRVDYEIEPISATRLDKAVQSLERMIGADFTDKLRKELAKAGIDLSDRSESYFLHELIEGLQLIFGPPATDILIDRIRKDLSENAE